MLLVFYFLLIILLLIAAILSCNVKIIIEANNKGHIIYACLYVFKFICLYKTDISKINHKMKNKNTLDKKRIIRIIRYLKLHLEELNIKIHIGANDSCITAILTGIINSVVYNIFSFFNLRINVKKNNFYISIIPVFENKKVLNIKFRCIISINLVHIISTIYRCKKDWRCKDYGRKSSNRRAYGNSNG